MLQLRCNRWINEVAGTRCELTAGHDGPCATSEQIAQFIRDATNTTQNYRAEDLRNTWKGETR